MGSIVRRAGLFVFLIACHSEKPTVASDTPAPTTTLASASASATASGPTLGPATGHVPFGPTGNIEENKVYSVDGTTLRIMLKNAMRATPSNGEGHVWSGMLTVCDGAACTELGLSGPDRPPGEWHGYKFALTFVVPTTLEISRK